MDIFPNLIWKIHYIHISSGRLNFDTFHSAVLDAFLLVFLTDRIVIVWENLRSQFSYFVPGASPTVLFAFRFLNKYVQKGDLVGTFQLRLICFMRGMNVLFFPLLYRRIISYTNIAKLTEHAEHQTNYSKNTHKLMNYYA